MKIIIIPNNQIMSARHYRLATELQAQGHDVTYFMWQQPYLLSLKGFLRHLFTSLIPGVYTHETFIVYKSVRLPLFWPIINGWIFKIQLSRIYRRIDADIIITETYTNETEVPKGLPFIYDLADDYAAPADAYGSTIYKFAFKILQVRKVMERQSRNAKAVTAVSKILYDFGQRHNPNTYMLPNGVDAEIITSILSRKTKPVNPYSMIYVTGFGQWSRALETLEAVVKLKPEFPQLELTLVGSGTEVERMTSFIKQAGAEDYIHYLGYIHDRRHLFKTMNASAIGLNVSHKNSWRDAAHPIKVLEYSALGKKVVSTDLNEVKLLNYNNVFMFEGDDIAGGMRRAMQSKSRLHYPAVSKQVLNQYDWRLITTQLIDIIHKSKLSEIVHVSYAYPPALGGLENVVQSLARAQHESGHNVRVITSDKGAGTIPTEGFQVTRLRSFVVANTTIIPKLLRVLCKVPKSSIVHLHVAQAYTPEIVWLASKFRKFSYVAHIHLDVPPSGPAGFLLKAYKPIVLGRVLRNAQAVIVFSAEQKLTMEQRYKLDNVVIVPNGAGAEYFYNPKRHLHKPVRFLFVGRLNYQKNLPPLLYALNDVTEPYKLTLVGEGEEMPALRKITKQLDLKHVTFAGRQDGEQLLKHYREADIFVLVSEREGMPLVLLESMAMALPIIATDVTGNRELVIDGKNGLLVPFNDTAALTKAINKLMVNNNLYEKMSANTRILAEQYSWEKIANQLDAIYRRNDEATDT